MNGSAATTGRWPCGFVKGQLLRRAINSFSFVSLIFNLSPSGPDKIVRARTLRALLFAGILSRTVRLQVNAGCDMRLG
jgi:hypothetical protein